MPDLDIRLSRRFSYLRTMLKARFYFLLVNHIFSANFFLILSVIGNRHLEVDNGDRRIQIAV